MTVERLVLITAGRVLDLLTVGRRTDELLATVLVLELLFLMGVMMVLRREVDEPADEPVPLRLATLTERLTGREKDGRAVETLGVDLDAGVDLTVLGGEAGRARETLGAGLGAGADLTVLGGELARGAETLGAGRGAVRRAGLDAGRLAVLESAFAAGRETRDRADLAGRADRLFGADLEAEARADLADRDDEDDLPLGGLGSPNAGPQAMIAVRSSANSVFSACLANIFLSPFPDRSFGFWKKTKRYPAHQTNIELFCFA